MTRRNSIKDALLKTFTCSTEHSKAHTMARPASNALPIKMENVQCSGNEQSLNTCPHNPTVGHTCTVDAGVDCFHPKPTTTPKPPTTTPSVVDRVSSATVVTCDNVEFNITVDTLKLQQLGLGTSTDFNAISVGDGACRGYRSGNLLVMNALLDTCVPIIQETTSSVIYGGKLRLYHRVVGEITRDEVTELDVRCVLYRSIAVEGEYVVHENLKQNKLIQATGRFNTTMDFFSDQFFHNKITSWPHHVHLNQVVYIQLSLESHDPHLSLMVQSCVARPSDTSSTKSYWLIRNRCSVDRTTVILPSGMDFARFKFSTFEFVNVVPEVYLDCQVTVCERGEVSDQCKPISCPHTSPPAIRLSRRDRRRTFQLSQGPLVLSGQPIKRILKQGIQLDVSQPDVAPVTRPRLSTAVVVVASCGTAVALVCLAVYLKKRIRGPIHTI